MSYRVETTTGDRSAPPKGKVTPSLQGAYKEAARRRMAATAPGAAVIIIDETDGTPIAQWGVNSAGAWVVASSGWL